MNKTLFFSTLGILLLASLGIALRSAKRTTNQKNYFQGESRLKMLPLMLTILAMQIGGGAVIGAAEAAYTNGWTALFYSMGLCFGLLLLAFGAGKKLLSLGLSSLSEIFEKCYGSVRLRKLSALISIASLFFILVGQAIAARKFFASLGGEEDLLFCLCWGILILYTTIGGIKGVIQTDILQILFLLGCFALTGVALFFTPPSEVPVEAISAASPSLPWSGWLLMPMLFMLIEQDVGQRCFAARSPKSIFWAMLLGSIILLIASCLPVYFGILARDYNLPIVTGQSILMSSVEAFTSPSITALFACAILMAIVSTANSLLNAISSNLCLDFSAKRNNLLFARGITLLLGGLSLLATFLFNNIGEMLVFSYELSICALFVPITMALIVKEPRKLSALLAIACGAGGFLLLRFLPLPFPKEVACLALSYSGFFLGKQLSKPKLAPA